MSRITCSACTHSHSAGGLLLLFFVFERHFLTVVVITVVRFAFLGPIRTCGGCALGVIVITGLASGDAAAFAFGAAVGVFFVDFTKVQFRDLLVLTATIRGFDEPELWFGCVGGTGATFEEATCYGLAVEFELDRGRSAAAAQVREREGR